MADIFVRNVWARHYGSYNEPTGRLIGFMMRELFLAGRWQIIDIGSDTGWTNNYLLTLSDAAVTVAEPLVVTSATGGFSSSHVGYAVSLDAVNDDIQGIYNIRNVVDSNTIELDRRTRKPTWPVDEGGMTLRMFNAANTQELGNTYFVAQAPAASGSNLQIYVTVDNSLNTMKYKAYPLGDYGGANTVTTERSDGQNYLYITRFNAYFTDPTADPFYAHIFYYDNVDNEWMNLMFGHFSDVVSGDTNPGFLEYNEGWDYLSNDSAMDGLNESGAPITYYPTFYKMWESWNDDDKRDSKLNTLRINGGKQKLFRPIVVAQGTADGSFIRGTDPRTFCHSSIGTFDEFGTDWWRMNNHALTPRDGADDTIPTTGTTF